MTRRLYRVPEVAEMLGVSCKLIWKMVGSREVNVVRLGRSVRITAEEVDYLIERGTTPAVGEFRSRRGQLPPARVTAALKSRTQ